MLTSDMSRLEEIFAVAELQALELRLWRLWNCLGFWMVLDFGAAEDEQKFVCDCFVGPFCISGSVLYLSKSSRDHA